MEAPRSGSRQIVKVQSRCQAEQLEGAVGLTRPSQERCVDGGGQRAAVGRARFVERQVRSEGVRHHLVRHEVVEHEHISLLDEL